MAQGPPAGNLFVDLPASPTGQPAAVPSIARRRAVSVNFQALQDALPVQSGGRGISDQLILNLFPDSTFIALRQRVEPTETGFVWVGSLRNVADSEVTLAVAGTAAGGVMSGNVVTPGGTFSIRYSPAGQQLIEQVDLNSFPAELPPLTPPAAGAGNAPVRAARDLPAAAADDGSTIDLLVVYTPAARVAAGGKAAMESLIDLGVSETNQAYANSGAIQRIRLRRKEETAYTEPGNDMSSDLNRLTATADGYLDSVHSLRETYGADLVQLIVNSPDSCGLSWLLDPMSASWSGYAFGVTHYSCISPNYSFGHEMGHNMGLHHDTAVDFSWSDYSFSHGYVNQAAFAQGASTDKRWRTIMAYNNQCSDHGFNCPRVLYFSNPGNTNTSDPMGDAASANAAQVLNNTRLTVSNFRLSVLPMDNYANVRDLFSNFFTDSLDTTAFTTEGSDPTPVCGGGVKSKSAWYRFTAGVSGVATISTAGSGYDTIVSAYTGTAGSFVNVGCNDDANATPQSQLSFTVSPGVTYSIMISAKANDGGALVVNAAVPITRKRTGQITGD